MLIRRMLIFWRSKSTLSQHNSAEERVVSCLTAWTRRQTPLPYPAVSHLLTLFSHDIPSLPLAQHVFDYLLSRPPIAVVYLAAAVR